MSPCQARQALARRDQQKQKLQEAVQKRDGPCLHQVVNDWEVDRSDEERKLMEWGAAGKSDSIQKMCCCGCLLLMSQICV